MHQPLADALRLQTLDEVCGQSHILGENGLLRRIIDSGNIPNMIFFMAHRARQDDGCEHHRQPHAPEALQAQCHDGLSGDIKEIYAQLDTFLARTGCFCILTIQYFNKVSIYCKI